MMILNLSVVLINIMRHKLERYHRDIRRQEHEALFKMRREQMLREEEAEAEIVGRSGRSLREES